jgi:hypothetical protein
VSYTCSCEDYLPSRRLEEGKGSQHPVLTRPSPSGKLTHSSVLYLTDEVALARRLGQDKGASQAAHNDDHICMKNSDQFCAGSDVLSSIHIS